MTKIVTSKTKKPIVQKKLATVALAGMLAVGAFTATPAFADPGSNGCSASGCNSKAETNSCQAKSGCKSACKGGCHSKEGKVTCKTKASCQTKTEEGKATCQSKVSCQNKAKCSGHNDDKRYND